MKISKTMIKEIDVTNMDAVEVLSEIGSAVGTMRTHCYGLDYVEFIKVEAFKVEVAGGCDCSIASTAPLHKMVCGTFKKQQNPHIRIVVKVGTKSQEEGKE